MRGVALILFANVLINTVPQVVTADGRIGALRMDVSARPSIISEYGRPDAERVGSFNDSSRYRALGYGCSTRKSKTAWPLLSRGPYCRTVFFLDPRDGKLGTFFTISPRYREQHGVLIGMPTATAERLLHRRVFVGCEENIHIGSLTIAFAGGRRAHDGHLIGGHVYAFALHGRTHDVGVFDCL